MCFICFRFSFYYKSSLKYVSIDTTDRYLVKIGTYNLISIAIGFQFRDLLSDVNTTSFEQYLYIAIIKN